MAIIKTVTNGSSSREFRAVSLGHAVAVVFGLCSIIGAQQTWLWAGANERRLIVESLREQIAQDISTHAAFEEKRFEVIDHRLSAIERSMFETQRQVNINTGKLERENRR